MWRLPPSPLPLKGGHIIFVLRLNVKSSHFPYYWFLHDIIKIQTKELSILLIFYFYEALEQLKLILIENFYFKRVLHFVIRYA